MKNKQLTLLFMFFLGFTSIGQKGQISGQINSESGNEIPFAQISIIELNKSFYSDKTGFFMSPKIPYGSYYISIKGNGFNEFKDTIEFTSQMPALKVKLQKNKDYTLDEIEVIRSKNNSFFIRRMKAIEGDILTQGKKTEVISLETIDANKATNSSRQIFARVPGLNIWESDGSGIQIGLGGRGLNPSRNVNFNTRQNGYDISADALGLVGLNSSSEKLHS